MRLTEVLVSIAIFLIASAVFTASLINVRRSITKSESTSKNAFQTLKTDALIRRRINKTEIPYWKTLNMEFESVKENLELWCIENNINLISISCVYDKKHKSEGIKIEWQLDGKNYESIEYIKQRIIDE